MNVTCIRGRPRWWLLLMGASLILMLSLLTLPRSGAAVAPPVTDLAAQAVNTGFQITWTSPDTSFSDIVGTLDRFEIERRNVASEDWTVLGSVDAETTAYLDANGESAGRFKENSTYHYRVFAIYVTDDEQEVRSDTIDQDWVQVSAPNFPDARDLDAVLHSTGVTLSWVTPGSDNEDDNSPLSGYIIRVKDNDLVVQRTESLDAEATEWTTDWEAGAVYELIAIWGIYVTEGSHFPGLVESTTDSPWRSPGAVSGTVSQSGLLLAWTEPYPSGTTVPGRLTGYQIQRRQTDGVFETLPWDIARDTLTWLDESPEDGFFVSDTTYVYRVVALYQNENGQGRESAPSEAGSIPVPTIAGPTGLEASSEASSTVGQTTHTLSWTAPSLSWSATLPALTGYRMVVSVDGVETTLNPAAQATSKSHDAAAGASVSYELSAKYYIFSSAPVTYPAP